MDFGGKILFIRQDRLGTENFARKAFYIDSILNNVVPYTLCDYINYNFSDRNNFMFL